VRKTAVVSTAEGRNEMSKQDVFIWVTRRGKEIPVTEMSDGHLENALAFVQGRKAHFCGLLLTSELVPGTFLFQLATIEHTVARLSRAETAFLQELIRRKREARENG